MTINITIKTLTNALIISSGPRNQYTIDNALANMTAGSIKIQALLKVQPDTSLISQVPSYVRIFQQFKYPGAVA